MEKTTENLFWGSGSLFVSSSWAWISPWRSSDLLKFPTAVQKIEDSGRPWPQVLFTVTCQLPVITLLTLCPWVFSLLSAVFVISHTSLASMASALCALAVFVAYLSMKDVILGKLVLLYRVFFRLSVMIANF